MIPGTITEQSFGFIQIDTKNEKIYITRVGAGNDYVLEYGSKLGEVTEYFVDQVTVKVTNGTVAGKAYATANPGSKLTLTADTITGYAFSHWVDANSEIVGNTAILEITVGMKSTTYQAIYTDTNSADDKTPAANQIATSVANDWQQGSYDGKFAAWSEGLRNSRITFAKPYLLKKGETITITYPKVAESLGACYTPATPCEGGCKLIAGIVAMKKIDGNDIGDLFTDYTIVSSGWRSSYTATEDIYVVCVMKFANHGQNAFNLSFPEMQDVVVTVTPAA
jgi:hypothetical protein